MTEKDRKYDENDPKIKERLSVLAEINAQTDVKIKDWQGMYDAMKDLAKAYIGNPTKHQADFTVTALLSFVLALEMLPEEGDIQVITHKMNEILVMRDDLTGAKVYVGAEAEAREAQEALMGAAALATLIGAVEGIASTTEEEPTDTKRTVH